MKTIDVDLLSEYKGKRIKLGCGEIGICCGITTSNQLIIVTESNEGWDIDGVLEKDDFILDEYIKEGNTYWLGSINNIELC